CGAEDGDVAGDGASSAERTGGDGDVAAVGAVDLERSERDGGPAGVRERAGEGQCAGGVFGQASAAVERAAVNAAADGERGGPVEADGAAAAERREGLRCIG